MTTIEWYRVYHGMPEDAKLRVIAKRSEQLMAHVVTVWLCVLDSASRHKQRGTVRIDSEQIAVMQDISQDAVEAILQAMREKGMIDAEGRVVSWETRQYLSDAERAKKYREGQKEDAPSQTVTSRHETSRAVTEQHASSRKNSKIQPDTDSRVQNADTENRSAESADAQKAESSDYKKSDKKLRARAEKKEREKEKQQIGGQAQSEDKAHSQILLQMRDIWDQEVQSKLTKGQKAILTAKRKEQMAERWLEDFQQDMRAWRYYCEIIGASDFCLGKIPGKNWTITLGWAVESSEHVAKILEGAFSGGNHPPKPPACEVTALQEAWDGVLAALVQKHGKGACRSWFAGTSIIRMLRHGDGAVVTMRCPSKFIQDWITQHYLADLNRFFAEATKDGARVTHVELIVEATV
ncbi:MAG: DnaA N-terminal domain-containing protein [Rickettsiales bacterium]|jgi:hypothetical protein|nr:DnaA N-terminal domain-containing protein [Rickettsiales bacterium]